jgi:hypothetical protein
LVILGRWRAAGQFEFSCEFPARHFKAAHYALFNSLLGGLWRKKKIGGRPNCPPPISFESG